MKKIILTLMFAITLSAHAFAQDSAATYPGGKAALDSVVAKTLVYPPIARENGVEGVIGVQFTVKADGTVGNVKIRRMVDPDLEAEAVRIVKSLKGWKPALREGKPIDSTVDLDIPFTLE